MKYIATLNFKCGREVTLKGSVYEGGDIDELLRKKLIEVAPEDSAESAPEPEKLVPEEAAVVVEPTPAPKGKKSKKG